MRRRELARPVLRVNEPEPPAERVLAVGLDREWLWETPSKRARHLSRTCGELRPSLTPPVGFGSELPLAARFCISTYFQQIGRNGLTPPMGGADVGTTRRSCDQVSVHR